MSFPNIAIGAFAPASSSNSSTFDSNFTYIASQSTIYSSNLQASYSSLNDFSGTTGAGTSNGSGEFIKANFTSTVTVSAITIGGGNLPSWGGVAVYLNGAKIQYSLDNTTWNDAVTIAGVTDTGADQFKKFALSSPISARYWRIFRSGYLAVTEFRFE